MASGERLSGDPSTRKLVLVVGRETQERREVANELMRRGHAAVICSGPPACVLRREEGCVLLNMADLVLMVAAPHHRDSDLERCAMSAKRALFAERSAIPVRADAAIAGTTNPHLLADAADAMLCDRPFPVADET